MSPNNTPPSTKTKNPLEKLMLTAECRPDGVYLTVKRDQEKTDITNIRKALADARKETP